MVFKQAMASLSWLSDTETFDMIGEPHLYGMTVILAS